jgi:hypothetical protein
LRVTFALAPVLSVTALGVANAVGAAGDAGDVSATVGEGATTGAGDEAATVVEMAAAVGLGLGSKVVKGSVDELDELDALVEGVWRPEHAAAARAALRATAAARGRRIAVLLRS